MITKLVIIVGVSIALVIGMYVLGRSIDERGWS